MTEFHFTVPAIFKTSVAAQPEIQLTTRVHHVISKRTEAPVTKVDVENCARVLPDDKIESLARKLLQNEDWQRLAHALGLLPCDVSKTRVPFPFESVTTLQNLIPQHRGRFIWPKVEKLQTF